MRFTRSVACIAIAAAALVACSSSSSKSSSSTTSTTKSKSTSTTSGGSSTCAAKTDLQKSVQALKDPSLLLQGKDAITAAVDDVKTNLDALAADAKSDVQPEVDAVKSAISDLETAVGNLGNGSVSANLEAVGTAIAKVGSTSADLVNALESECPSS